MSPLIRRIEKLEARLLPVQLPSSFPTARTVRIRDALELLLERMEPEHRSLVVEDLKRFSKTFDRLSDFTCVVFHYVDQHVGWNTPLQLPGPVATAYLQHPEVKANSECADCGYDIPFDWAYPLAHPPRPVTVYFERCPICGGTAGPSAFYSKHGYFKYSHPHDQATESEKPTRSFRVSHQRRFNLILNKEERPIQDKKCQA